MLVGGFIGLVAALAPTYPGVKKWAEDWFNTLEPMVTAPWFLLLSIILILGYIAALVWPSQPKPRNQLLREESLRRKDEFLLDVLSGRHDRQELQTAPLDSRSPPILFSGLVKRDTNEKRSEFIDDWNAMVAHVAEFSAKHELPVGELVFPPLVLDNLRDACGERLLDTFIVNGVRTRFGRFVQADVFRQY